MSTYVLYHTGCNDGSVSAWVAWQNLANEEVKFAPYQYGGKFPKSANDHHLILLDLSLPQEMIDQLIASKTVKSILIIDHHKSAIEKLSDVPMVDRYGDYLRRRDSEPVLGYLDSSVAGAMLTWRFFTPKWETETPPEVVYLADDYDRWVHQDKRSKYLARYTLAMCPTFLYLDDVLDENGKVMQKAFDIGHAILSVEENLANSIIKSYTRYIDVEEGLAALVNGPHHIRNEMSDQLNSQGCAYTVCYNVRKDRTVFSLRSNDHDIEYIARRYGGGGHASAAAFSIDNSDPRLKNIPALFTGKFGWMTRLQHFVWKHTAGRRQ